MFLEKLIFGKPLPPFAEKYPSTIRCDKPHCTSKCSNDIWSLVLSEKKLSHASLINLTFPDELRISIWYKLVDRPSNSIKFKDAKFDRQLVRTILEFYRDKTSAMIGAKESERMVFEIYKSVVEQFYGCERMEVDGGVEDKIIDSEKLEDKEINENLNVEDKGENINHGNENNNENNNENHDEKNDDISIDNKKLIDTISNNLKTQKIYLKESETLIDLDLIKLIDYLLNQLHSTDTISFNIIYVLFERMCFDKVYLTPTLSPDFLKIESNLFNSILVATDFTFIKLFISKCIKKKLHRIFDIIFVFSSTVLFDIIKFILEKINIQEILPKKTSTQSENEIKKQKDYLNQTITNKMIQYVIHEENLTKMIKTLKIKEYASIPVKCTQKDEYFDFMIVLNQITTSDECLKKEMAEKLSVLMKANAELELRNENLKMNLENMEKERYDFEEMYVKNVKKMLVDATQKADSLEKENLNLKKKMEKK